MEKVFQFITATVGGAISFLVGGWGMLLTVLLILNAIDFITGMAANWGTITRKRGYQGLIKKGILWVWIVVANLVYLVLLDQGFQVGQVIPDAVVLMFIINEIISFGENSSKLGLPMPGPIQKALDVFNDKKGSDAK